MDALRLIRGRHCAVARNRGVLRNARSVTQERLIKSNDRILLFNTGAVQKHPEVVREQLPRIDISKPIDWNAV